MLDEKIRHHENLTNEHLHHSTNSLSEGRKGKKAFMFMLKSHMSFSLDICLCGLGMLTFGTPRHSKAKSLSFSISKDTSGFV